MTRSLPFYPHNLQDPPRDPGRSGLRVLKPATNNRKLAGSVGSGRTFDRARTVYGRKLTRHVVRVGDYAGFPLYSLTLPERTTCPRTCGNWTTCYGRSMPFAHRYNPGPGLVQALADDVATLSGRYPPGFVVRLHVLGDFYSCEYVDTWRTLLARFRPLHVFGYTHRKPGDPIGDRVADVVQAYPDRFRVLRSDPDPAAGPDPLPGAHTLQAGATDPVPGSVVCPEQIGRTASCLTCGLCMNGRTSVSFLLH